MTNAMGEEPENIIVHEVGATQAKVLVNMPDADELFSNDVS